MLILVSHRSIFLMYFVINRVRIVMKNRLKVFIIIAGACVSLYIAMTASNYIDLVYSSWKDGYNISLTVDSKRSTSSFDIILGIYNSRWRWYLHFPCDKKIIIHDSVNPEYMSNWDVILVKDGMIQLKNNKQIILVSNACKV